MSLSKLRKVPSFSDPERSEPPPTPREVTIKGVRNLRLWEKDFTFDTKDAAVGSVVSEKTWRIETTYNSKVGEKVNYCCKNPQCPAHLQLLYHCDSLKFRSTWADEFRFCYKGLHRVSDSECPHGIYFPEPIPSPCITHLPEYDTNSGHSGVVYIRLVSSLCEEDNPQESEMTPGEVYNNITFQHVNFLRTSKLANFGPNQVTGNECSLECEEDATTSQRAEENEIDREDEDIEDPYEDVPPATPEIQAEQMSLGRSFMEYLIGLSDGTEKAAEMDENKMKDSSKDLRLLKLFRSSVEILQANCGDPWVPVQYWDTIYYAFKWIFTRVVPSEFMDIGLEQYKGIKAILKACLRTTRSYELVGNVCESRAKVISMNFTNTDGRRSSILNRPKPYSYHWGKYDIFMESAWAAVDFVHGFCFASFEPDYNLEHIYFDGMEGLYTAEIQRRWLYFRGIRDEFYWDFLTGVADIKLVMRNINACLEASYLKSPYVHRLERPFYRPRTTINTPVQQPTDRSQFNIDNLSSWCANSGKERDELHEDSSFYCKTTL